VGLLVVGGRLGDRSNAIEFEFDDEFEFEPFLTPTHSGRMCAPSHQRATRFAFRLCVPATSGSSAGGILLPATTDGPGDTHPPATL